MFRISAYDREGKQVVVVDAPGGEITIGREPDRRMMLASPSVSRRHARIVLDGPQPYIVDEGSANGVLVNGVRIGSPTALAPGVRVDIAEFWLDFAVADSDPQAAPPPQPPPQPPPAPMPMPPPMPPPQAQQPVGVLRLRAQGGPFAGRAFDVPPGRVAIGRAIDNDLVFDDPSLSRKHAVVQMSGRDRLEAQDLGSSNGTWLNGRKVDSAVATVGDSLRLGDLMFVLEGDVPIAVPNPYPSPQPSRMPVYDDYPPPPSGPSWLLVGGLGVGVMALVALVTLLIVRWGGAPGGGGKGSGGHESVVSITEQVNTHFKLGKDKLEAKQFDAAMAEFDEVIKLDPTNSSGRLGEARTKRLLAASEPDNDKQARKIVAKASLGDRSDLEAAVRMIAQLPSDSTFHDPTAQKVASKLVLFGDAQCKARKYLDCAWAICRAIDLAPPEVRSSVIGPTIEGEMREAEKKSTREKGFVPCQRK